MSPYPNLSRAAFSQGSKLYRVRSGVGAWDDSGEAIETYGSDRKVRGSIRPVSFSDRKYLPEGVRIEDTITMLTRKALKVERNESNGAAVPDRVWYQDVWWKLVSEKPWAENGFRRYFGIREAPGGEPRS